MGVAMKFQGCWECGKDLPEGRRKFCKTACGTNFSRRRFREPLPGDSDRSRIGAVAEMLVAADLLGRDKDVLRSLNPHGGFDLAILADNKPLRIEVKTGHLCENTVLFADTGHGAEGRRGRRESDEQTKHFDILAVALVRQREVIYDPEPEDWGKKECSVRRRERTMPYTVIPNRRVIQERTWVSDGKLHVEFEQDGTVLEMMLKYFPELAQLSNDEARKVVVRNGYWLRWPRLDFEINVTDFLRAAPRKIRGRP
jgi:hypothetical protein